MPLLSNSQLRRGTVPMVRAYYNGTIVWTGAPQVSFTVNGTSFEPWIELAPASTAEVLWLDNTGSILSTSLTPEIVFDTAGPHIVRLVCDVPEDVVTVNLGFHNDQDNGIYSLSSSYNYPTQPVTRIDNLQYLSGLQRFMAARTNGVSPDGTLYVGPLLGGHIDFSGMTTIEYIECFMAELTSINLEGCSSIVRLCLEQNNFTELDLNPVTGSLLDLRAAFQLSGTLTLTPITSPFTNLYHFCTRRQTLINMPNVETMLPEIRQLWVWNNTLNESEIVIRSSEVLHSVILSTAQSGGVANQIDTLDLAGQTFGTISGEVSPRIIANGLDLTDVVLTGMGPVGTIELEDNQLDETVVDHILTVVDSWNNNNGNLRLSGNAPPSPAGIELITELQSRSWFVNYTTPTTILHTFEFDTPGDALSQGWYRGASETDTTATIADGVLTWSGVESYRRLAHNGPSGFPLNCEVDLVFDITTPGGHPGAFWGVMSRFGGNSGARVLFRSSPSILRIGNTSNSSDQADIDVAAQLATVPGGWDSVGEHTVTFRAEGTTYRVYWDGVFLASRAAALSGATGPGIGICGEPRDRSWKRIVVKTF